jgi:hypothetical protein
VIKRKKNTDMDAHNTAEQYTPTAPAWPTADDLRPPADLSDETARSAWIHALHTDARRPEWDRYPSIEDKIRRIWDWLHIDSEMQRRRLEAASNDIAAGAEYLKSLHAPSERDEFDSAGARIQAAALAARTGLPVYNPTTGRIDPGAQPRTGASGTTIWSY